MRMSADEAVNNVINMLDGLSSTEQPYEALQQLKTAVFAIHPTALERVVANFSFNVVFDFLDTDDVARIEVCCSVLSRLLGALPPSAIISNFASELIVGIEHENAHVRSLTQDSLHRCCVDGDAALLLARRPDVLKRMVSDLGSEDGATSQRIRGSFIAFGQHPYGWESLLGGEASPDLERLQQSNSINRYRVFEVVVGISSHSAASLDFAVVSGFLPPLLEDLEESDVLLRLNCVELLADLSATPHGLAHLERAGVVERVEALLRHVDDDPLASLLLPALVKFFGHLMYHYPERLSSRWNGVLKMVLELVNEGKPSAVDTLGLIGASPAGKEALLGSRADADLNSAIRRIGQLSLSTASDHDAQIRALEAAAHLLKLPADHQTPSLLEATKSWFESLASPSPVAEILRLCQLPFTGVRHAALRLVCAVADQVWAQTIFCDHPGFKEYLLNRDSESELEGWHVKYAVVETLAAAPTTRDVFGDPYFIRLKAYLAEGPVYKRTEAEVATMEL